MAALRTLVSLAGADDPRRIPARRRGGLRTAARLTAQQPVLVAAIEAARRGTPLPDPDPGLGLAANFLLQLSGRAPEPRAAEILDACLVLQADHLMTALHVRGPGLRRHPGRHARGRDRRPGRPVRPPARRRQRAVRRELEAARAAGGDPVAAAAEQVSARLRRGEPITGFGHRAYRGRDPRAELLRELSAELAGARRRHLPPDGGPDRGHRPGRARPVPERRLLRGHRLPLPGHPAGLATPVLSVARMAGWTAHVLEQYADNRLIRPGSAYIGESGLTWIPVADR